MLLSKDMKEAKNSIIIITGASKLHLQRKLSLLTVLVSTQKTRDNPNKLAL